MISRRSVQERRKDPRLANNVPVRISQDNGETVTETANISRSGAYCRINQKVEPMTKLKVHLLLPMRKKGRSATKKICCEGVVVRTEPDTEEGFYNIAIFFNDISQRDAENIADYVNSYLEHEPS